MRQIKLKDWYCFSSLLGKQIILEQSRLIKLELALMLCCFLRTLRFHFKLRHVLYKLFLCVNQLNLDICFHFFFLMSVQSLWDSGIELLCNINSNLNCLLLN
jgi:hypothetical protein